MSKSLWSRAWSGLGSGVRSFVRALPSLICDLAGFAGAGLVAYGAWLVYAPAGFLVGGVLLIALSILAGRRLDARTSA